MTIFDRLATIDPALTEQQRCVHEWKVIDRLFQGSVLRHRCSKCGYEAASDDITPVPLVGDGDNEEKFNSLDALVRLCDGLGLFVTFLGFQRHDELGDLASAAVTPDDRLTPQKAYERNEPFERGHEEQRALRMALATAILKAKGVAVE